MTANDIANMVEKEPYHTNLNRTTIAYFIRQQQAEMEELEKENTDLRYLIATKLEQQDGISLNSMAHPITNTPEPSYEIDSDKLETIEIDLPSPEPVAWAVWEGRPHDLFFTKEDADELCRLKGGDAKSVPLYTHPVKELTDEEIEIALYVADITLNNLSDGDISMERIKAFVRTILRKAQEK